MFHSGAMLQVIGPWVLVLAPSHRIVPTTVALVQGLQITYLHSRRVCEQIAADRLTLLVVVLLVRVLEA